MAIPDYFKDELKEKVDLAKIVSSYVNLKKAGNVYKGVCPFHNEKTASFNVYEKHFHCFGCNAHGDVIEFVKRIENLDFVEAMTLIAEKEGIAVPESGVENPQVKLRKRLFEINKKTAEFYHNYLFTKDGEVAQRYLIGRQLKLKTVQNFKIGYSPKGGFALVNHLRNLGYSNEEMVLANVAKISAKGNPYDIFQGRVMFPILDLRGNVVAFGGRIIGDEKPKYINSSDTPIYHKGKFLFALNIAKDSKEPLILAEGYMDVIALHAAGFTGAIASLGTALTNEQAKIIANYKKEVVICYDSDNAGQTATQKAIDILRETGINIKILSLPNGKDPDEFIKNNGEKGPAAFRYLLEKCGNDIEYRFAKLKSTFNIEIEDDKVKYIIEAAKILSNLENPIEIEVYAGKLSAELGISKDAVLGQIKKSRIPKIRKEQREFERKRSMEMSGVGDKINPDKEKNLKIANAEESLLAYIFKTVGAVDYCKERITSKDFCTDFGKRVYNIILKKNTENGSVDLSDVTSDFTDAEFGVLSKIVYSNFDVNIDRQDADLYIKIIKEDGAFSNAENIKNANNQQLADYFEKLKQRKTQQ